MDTLGAAGLGFALSAAAVVGAGIGLARYGDALAQVTGWGRLWIGTLLVGIATSLPELAVNVSAVWLEGLPALALGNVFGACMINMLVLACVALGFGTTWLFCERGRDIDLLMRVAFGLAALALAVGAIGDVKLGPTSLGGLVIFAAYVGGMRLVYRASRVQGDAQDRDKPIATGARRAWTGFLISALVVIIAGRFLAASAERITELSGISASFIGVVLVSFVTTLPEATVTVAAALRKAYGIALGNAFGSNAFNVTILALSDLFMPTPLLAQMDSAHYAAAAAALVLMGASYLVWKGCHVPAYARARMLTPAIPFIYLGALYLIYRLAQG